jgi:hypothetical protein
MLFQFLQNRIQDFSFVIINCLSDVYKFLSGMI